MKRKQITTSFNVSFEEMFDDIKRLRSDLHNNNQVAQEGVRELWKKLKKEVEKVEKKG